MKIPNQAWKIQHTYLTEIDDILCESAKITWIFLVSVVSDLGFLSQWEILKLLSVTSQLTVLIIIV